MANFSDYVNDAFTSLTPDLKNIYSDAIEFSLSDWKAKQTTLVTASGAASVSIPFLHLAGIPADVTFLMNRMSVCSFGIGAIISKYAGLGNILEPEDFSIILGRWCEEPTLTNAAISKTTAELATKTGSKIAAKELSKVACKHLGIVVGQKLSGKVGAKLGGKFGAKLGGKLLGGFIPIFGAAVGAGVNIYFINEIQTQAESWYRFKTKHT